MGTTTNIAYAEHTFNIAWGCAAVSEGCDNCYARAWARRCGCDCWEDSPRRTFGAAHWAEPLAWNRRAELRRKPAVVLCSSMCDVFERHETIRRERAKLWPLIRSTSWLVWLLLTKRATEIARALPDDWSPALYANVWLGVTVECDRRRYRADYLRQVPAALRFLSCEPALGPLDCVELAGIGWVIYGGESGPGWRDHNPEWARRLFAECETRGIPFFYKQSPGPRPGLNPTLDGRTIRQVPAWSGLAVLGVQSGAETR